MLYLDSQRTFNESQREYLYLDTSGYCQRCDAALPIVWDVHHIIHWIDGGKTEVTNGMAVCQQCHIVLHRRKKMITPRGWQKNAVEKYKACSGDFFLVDATPGSGKTYLSGFCIKEVQKEYPNIFIVIVVPTTAIKKSFCDAYHDLGIELKPELKHARGRPTEFDGAVVTYHQLPNLVKTFKIWVKNQKQQILFVFDEIHHTSRENIWGNAANECGTLAAKIIAMSGTPFRSDGYPITFINYDEDGVAISDATYSYRMAVTDNVCRSIEFPQGDGTAEWTLDDDEESVEISEITTKDEYKAAATIFKPGSKWMEAAIRTCNNQLMQYRKVYPNAGGIVICRPGKSDIDERHIHAIAKLMTDILGEKPVIITHDEESANDKIEDFKRSSTKWIISVRKIAEGVDIKRLRVMLLLSLPNSELFFRQLAGRILRVENTDNNPEDAQMYIANHPRLVTWAERISMESEIGLKEHKEKSEVENEIEDDFNDKPIFDPKECSHIDAGCTSMDGEHFSVDEMQKATQIKRGDNALEHVSVTTIAGILRRGFEFTEKNNDNNRESDPVSLFQQKQHKRNQINALCQKINGIRQRASNLSKDKFNYKAVHQQWNKIIKVQNIEDLVDNHPIEKMDETIALLREWL